VHFYGAPVLSFTDQVELREGDVMVVEFAGFGRPLRNVVRVAARVWEPTLVRSLA
jgi:hypothetical protein